MNPKLRDERRWALPVYQWTGNAWTEAGTLPHRTEIIVREQYPAADGSPDGWLLVEAPDTRDQYCIRTDNFIFKEQSYAARDRTVVRYYLYVPDADPPAEKWPVLIYLHGIRDTMARHHGICELIRSHQLSPQGIVIIPQAVSGTKDSDFHSKKYQDAVLELAEFAAETCGGNLNRLSVSGHSDGGTAVYKFVNNHPGVFAACAPISAIGNTDKGIRMTALWVFQGAKDFWVKPSVGLRVVLKCERAGCDARHYIYENEGHDIQTMAWLDTFTDENGGELKLIDWLMSKRLNP